MPLWGNKSANCSWTSLVFRVQVVHNPNITNTIDLIEVSTVEFHFELDPEDRCLDAMLPPRAPIIPGLISRRFRWPHGGQRPAFILTTCEGCCKGDVSSISYNESTPHTSSISPTETCHPPGVL